MNMSKLKKSILFLSVFTICLSTVYAGTSISNAATDQPLRVLAEQLRQKGRDFYIGCAVPSNFSSSDQDIVKREFDIVTCENDMKIGTISPSRYQYNYSGGTGLDLLSEGTDHGKHRC